MRHTASSASPGWTARHLRRVARRHLDRLDATERASAGRITDKMPDNYLYLGLLATLFPRAKLIHCRRDLRDVAVSCWMTQLPAESAGPTIRNTSPRGFRQYQRLMDHWRRVLPVPLLEVDYEETVADLEGVARRLVGVVRAGAGSRRAWPFTRTAGRCAPPASPRFVSRSTRIRSHGGSITSSPWPRCLRGCSVQAQSWARRRNSSSELA